MVVNFDPPNNGVTVGAGGILGPVAHKSRHKRPILSQVSSDHTWWNQSAVTWDVAYFTRNPLGVRTSQILSFMKSFVVFVCKQQIPFLDKSPTVIFEGLTKCGKLIIITHSKLKKKSFQRAKGRLTSLAVFSSSTAEVTRVATRTWENKKESFFNFHFFQ